MEDGGEALGSRLGMAAKSHQGGDFAGATEHRSGQPAEVEPACGVDEGVEVEREVFPCGVGDDADGGSREAALPAEFSDDAGFHLHGVSPGAFAESGFFRSRGGDALGAVEAGWEGSGSEQAGAEGKGVVRITEDGAPGEGGVEATGEPAGEDGAPVAGGEVLPGGGFRSGRSHPRDDNCDMVGQDAAEGGSFLAHGKADEHGGPEGAGHGQREAAGRASKSLRWVASASRGQEFRYMSYLR